MKIRDKLESERKKVRFLSDQVKNLQIQLALTEKECQQLKTENKKMKAENKSLRDHVADQTAQKEPHNYRGAGRKKHDEYWQESYDIYKYCFENGLNLEHSKCYVNAALRGSRYSGSKVRLKKFSKSTYYRLKKIYQEEQEGSNN